MRKVLVALLVTLFVFSPAEAQRSSGGRSSSAAASIRSTPTTPSGSGSLSSTAPSTPTTSPTNPQSTIAPPAPTAQQIAPLSPSLPTGQSTGGTLPNGGSGQGSLALSPGTPAPSQPGGGGKSLQDCMNFWDRQTHMTKAEWREACKRTMQEFPTIR
jgi:hypothetical protein